MQELGGKTVFITGGASGIGLGMARAFAEAGAKIALADIDLAALDAACSDLRGRGADVATVDLQVADAAAWPAALAKAELALGPVRVLCCNAGVGGRPGPIESITPDDWRRVFAVNCDGVFFGVRAFLPSLLASGEEGHIVITSSLAALAPAGGGAAYAASKAAAWTFGEALRVELEGTPIGVSVLFPGTTRTNFFANTAKSLGQTAPAAGALAALLAAGADPDDLGRRVRDGVLANEMNLPTHPAWKPLVEKRLLELLDSFPPLQGPLAQEDVSGVMAAASERVRAARAPRDRKDNT